MTHNTTPPIVLSIIICTHRRPDSLALTLRSLAEQQLPAVGYEILVVENDTAPSPEVARHVEQAAATLPIRLIFCTPPNLSRARNTGAEHAAGIYLAYLDDDVELMPGWLLTLYTRLPADDPDLFCGPSVPLYRLPKPRWFSEDDEYANQYGTVSRTLTPSEPLSGMNFGAKKTIFTRVGGFREDLGMAGNKLAYGEETYFCLAAWQAQPNLHVRYYPEAGVKHEVREVKMRMGFYLKRAIACGRDQAKFNTTPPPMVKCLYRLARAGAQSLWALMQLGGQLLLGWTVRRDHAWWAGIGRQLTHRVYQALYGWSANWHDLVHRRP